MNTQENTPRPFGYWLKTVDRLMAAEFATAFAQEGASRRDWRLLNLIDGTVASRRPLHMHKAHDLIDRGWVERTSTGLTLTDEGRAAKERLGALVANIRATVTDAASPEEIETTLATLEKVARAFGWEEGIRVPRPHDHQAQRGDRFGRDHHRRPGHHSHHDAHCTAHSSQHAFERGFDHGFCRGRDA